MDPSVTQRGVLEFVTSELEKLFLNTVHHKSYRIPARTHNSPCPPLPGHLSVLQRRKTCGECLSNSSQCAWCESAQACFYFAAYLTKYPYGECRDWYDR